MNGLAEQPLEQFPNLARASDRLDGWVSSGRIMRAQTIAFASDLGWRGVDFCLGVNTGADFDDVTPNGHFIGIQLNDAPIETRIKTDAGWTNIVNPPMGLWIHPQGQTFSIRHRVQSRWAGIVVPSSVLDRVCRSPMDIRPARGISDELSAHIFCSLIHQLSSPDPAVANNKALSEQLIRALIIAVSRNANPARIKGGLTEHQIKAIKELALENLDGDLSVDRMAKLINISKAHFSREFKRATGSTPWDFVIGLRAERARELLMQGEAACSVAALCGFADQAHLCRVIRARYGTSPSQLRKALN